MGEIFASLENISRLYADDVKIHTCSWHCMERYVKIFLLFPICVCEIGSPESDFEISKLLLV